MNFYSIEDRNEVSKKGQGFSLANAHSVSLWVVHTRGGFLYSLIDNDRDIRLHAVGKMAVY
jgi:hypothetical protein